MENRNQGDGIAETAKPLSEIKKAKRIAENLEHFFEASIVQINPDGTIGHYNRRAVELFEMPHEIAAKGHIGGFVRYLAERGDFGPGDPKQFETIINGVINDPTQAMQATRDKTQTYLTMPSGNVLRVMMRRNRDGSVILSAHDISEQRRKENMLEMALDVGLAGYLVFDPITDNFDIQSRYLSNILTAHELQVMETSGPSALLHPDDMGRIMEMWKVVRRGGDAQKGTLRVLTEKHGPRWFRFEMTPEDRNYISKKIILFFNDITDSLKQQERLRKAKQRAEDTLQSKEDFLAMMSHEIRTPMNAVVGISDALIHHHGDSEINSELELIQASAASILKMLDETLTHSRLDTNKFTLDPAPASPADVVTNVCALWEKQALKNGNKIRCVIKDNVPSSIMFDRFRYEQCVNNLLSNAIKFTNCGTVDVVLTTVEKDGHPPRLVLAVRDSGIGMTAEQQIKIFKAYTQADKTISARFGGTGLGMNITKQIAELMDGTVSVRSEIGNGSLFVLTVPIIAIAKNSANSVERDEVKITPPTQNLPDQILIEPETLLLPDSPLLIEPEATQILETSVGLIDQMLDEARPEATAYSHLNVLVVDDNSTNHIVVTSLLGSIVANIHTAGNGEQALSVLETTPIDIVLMDIHMPVMDGIECTLAIRGSDTDWKDVPIIALTADPRYQQRKLCINIGMNETLAKPVRLTDLIETIDVVLAQTVDEIEDAA